MTRTVTIVCPKCNSNDLRRVALVYAAEKYESRGHFGGLIVGDSNGLLFGRHRGTSQSQLSAILSPPRKATILAPAILWLVGFFVLTGFAGRGKLTWLMGALTAGYILLFPVCCLLSLFYNLVVRPKKLKNWERQFICQRCGTITCVGSKN